MKLSNILIGSAILLSAASCTTLKKTATQVHVDSAVKSITLADADVQPKVTAETTWSWNPFLRDKVALRKGNLVAETLQKCGADVLLEPQYIFTKNSFGERKIVVTGFPAKYKNFRTATPADAPLLIAIPNERQELNQGGGSIIPFIK